eukprot:1595566-Alexandrium_andersonii.AAC.1
MLLCTLCNCADREELLWTLSFDGPLLGTSGVVRQRCRPSKVSTITVATTVVNDGDDKATWWQQHCQGCNLIAQPRW